MQANVSIRVIELCVTVLYFGIVYCCITSIKTRRVRMNNSRRTPLMMWRPQEVAALFCVAIGGEETTH